MQELLLGRFIGDHGRPGCSIRLVALGGGPEHEFRPGDIVTYRRLDMGDGIATVNDSDYHLLADEVVPLSPLELLAREAASEIL